MPSNSFDTYEAKGNREGLLDIIYNVDPDETPFVSKAARSTATATLHEWQTDGLDTVSAVNKAVEGDNATIAAVTATARLTNQCMISSKTFGITGTQQAVKKAGRKDEMAYQTAIKGKALRNDIEASCLSNVVVAAGDASTARQTAGIETFLATNAKVGAGAGAVGGAGTTARTAGTTYALAESNVQDVIQQIWTSGGKPDCILVNGGGKQEFGAFTGSSTVTNYNSGNAKELVSAVDVYISDFDTLTIMPCRHLSNDTTGGGSTTDSMLILQSNMWAVAYLRPFEVLDIARKGDSLEKELVAEYALEARNEKSSGVVADFT
jgi:hypothetical protein